MVLANVNEYDINQTWLTYAQWFHLQGALIVCSVLYVVWDIVRAARARSISQVTIWSYYFTAGAAMGMLTGKWGAGPTYLIAAIAASCVCTVGLLWRVVHLRISVRRFMSVSSTLALLCAGVFMVRCVERATAHQRRLFGQWLAHLRRWAIDVSPFLTMIRWVTHSWASLDAAMLQRLGTGEHCGEAKGP